MVPAVAGTNASPINAQALLVLKENETVCEPEEAPFLYSLAPNIVLPEVVIAMLLNAAPTLTVGLLLMKAAPITISLDFVVVNETEGLVLVPVDIAGVLRFGSKGEVVSAPLIPMAEITNRRDVLKVAVIDALERVPDEIA